MRSLFKEFPCIQTAAAMVPVSIHCWNCPYITHGWNCPYMTCSKPCTLCIRLLGDICSKNCPGIRQHQLLGLEVLRVENVYLRPIPTHALFVLDIENISGRVISRVSQSRSYGGHLISTLMIYLVTAFTLLPKQLMFGIVPSMTHLTKFLSNIFSWK